MRPFQHPRRRPEAGRDPRTRTCYEEQQHKLLVQEKMKESPTWWCGNEDRNGGSSPGARSGLVLWSSTLRIAAQVRKGYLHWDPRRQGTKVWCRFPLDVFSGTSCEEMCEHWWIDAAATLCWLDSSSARQGRRKIVLTRLRWNLVYADPCNCARKTLFYIEK